jgi:lysophospholipase L1-like esterase
MAISFNRDTRFLFAGDTMTEAERTADPEGLGSGYVQIVRDFIRAQHPPTAPIVINRGQRGRTVDVAARWKEDVLAERPDVLSIHFDLNAASNPPEQLSVDQYHAVYRQVLVQTREFLPKCKLVFCQPAAVWSKTAVEADEKLRPYAQALFELNAEFDGEVIVPLHEAFVFSRRARPDVQWFVDQSTLTPSGHMLVAYTWLESCGMVKRAFT